MGLAFTGNARAAANAIPAECTTQNQNSPSSQYQEPNPTNTDLNPNRVWLRDSMRGNFLPFCLTQSMTVV
ncbi:MAG: hypothetical protein IV298_13090 [Cylindrospermopsis raciborskii KL1]|jgi:hypothetical protein|uniref:hypothetical protein n=1 Tax=Cylindrospermopsis raciborskii TaxID=77022 RepID=UPI001A3514BB|nr:hypothetical protein [Cylindrospermopsis raciborskii]MBG0744396.1 hypothetical protein [Cylindrospermopsis raciborskii KL1]